MQSFSCFFRNAISTCLLICLAALSSSAQTPPRSPSATVLEFYKAMREKRFREAFALSIYKPAIDGLKPQEMEDLRPDFDNMAAAIPENVELNGEQISGGIATVFVKVPNMTDPAGQPEPLTLMLVNNEWIIGDKENQAVVKKAGNSFFFNLRITTHQNDATDMLQKISVAELIYS
ncbi:MAG TPA: hypothetical protein VGN86_14320, partial [Pyrinomonadaceae bacterium]|nr:hypothetical protein [Pyrinomonadaceae bacterium]